ncbi:sensor histidine kinase [Streptomyces sparsus]
MTETGEVVHGRNRRAVLWWPRRRSAVLDISLAAVSAVECAFQGVLFAREAGIPTAAGVLLGVLTGATLVLRRRLPIAVVLVAIAVIPAQMGYLLATVGFYTLAASDVPRRIIVLLTGMEMAGIFVIVFIRMQQSSGQEELPGPMWFLALVAALLALVVTVPPVLLGMYAGARRRLVDALRERADGLERELSLLADRAEERAEWARNEERTRIAREMHDVVAHRVSLMVVHAAALQAVALKDPEKAARNAGLVGDMGRQALTELRTMLGVLRAHETSTVAGSVPGGGGDLPLARIAQAAAAAAEREGAEGPGLAGLPRLVEESRAAGTSVELSVEGGARTYQPLVERTAYRVVQEALTNVHKHAAGASVRVRVAHRPAEVAVLVENGVPAAGGADADLPSGGNGLVGMRERVTALGGGFVSGPTAAGGFRVSAVIPDCT